MNAEERRLRNQLNLKAMKIKGKLLKEEKKKFLKAAGKLRAEYDKKKAALDKQHRARLQEIQDMEVTLGDEDHLG